MNNYKTVKEVCALTGLTGKHLYYFHHENVVRAVAYANYSVEGNDGYKLYDDAGVEKLQQIALYYQLGLKRNEIRDIMLDPNYDSNLVLETLLALEQTKREKIDRQIAALEYLKQTGTKNGLVGMLNGISLEDLGQAIIAMRGGDANHPADRNARLPEGFTGEFMRLLEKLSQMDDHDLMGQTGEKLIGEIFALGKKHLGDNAYPYMIGLFVSALGDGEIAREFGHKISAVQGKAVIRYIAGHPEIYNAAPYGQQE